MNCLILGAGLMQKPAILSAKELGYKVCVVDQDKNAICIQYADEFRNIDLKDKDGILQYAKHLQQNGELSCIFTAGTDFTSSVSYVCEKLNLPSHSYKASLNASIKNLMRKCFEQNNVPSPSFISVTKNELNENLYKKIIQKINFPLVVKPVDNMGARGCRLARNEIELKSAIQKAVDCSKTQTAIIEEYMEGPEYSIDALIYNGTFTVTGFAERHIKYPPYFIEVGHTMPAVLEKSIHDELISVFALAAKSLGLTCGAAKADIKFTKKGAMIGEIAGRLSGGYMSGWTFPYSSDFNLTKEAIIIASGNEPKNLIEQRIPVSFSNAESCKGKDKPYELFEILSKRTSTERAWMSISGEVEYIENINDFSDKAVFDTLPRTTINIGSTVDFPRNNVEKCGNIICVSHDKNVAIQVAENAVSNIFITLKPNTKLTDDFLSRTFSNDETNFPPDAFCKLTDDELLQINGQIKENTSFFEQIPLILKEKKFTDLVDWNYNTIFETLKKIDILRPRHKTVDSKLFYKALFRGGIQGAIYFLDSSRR